MAEPKRIKFKPREPSGVGGINLSKSNNRNIIINQEVSKLLNELDQMPNPYTPSTRQATFPMTGRAINEYESKMMQRAMEMQRAAVEQYTGRSNGNGLQDLQRKLELEITKNKKQEEQVKQLTETLERLSEAATIYGSVLEIKEDRIVLGTKADTLSVKKPTDIEVKPGMIVRLASDTMQIVGIADVAAVGLSFPVIREDDTGCIVGIGPQEKKVLVNEGIKLKVGAKVILDPTQNVVIHVAELPQDYAVKLDKKTLWEEIIGNDEAKRELRELVELTRSESPVLAAYRYEPPKGVLLYGSPGCGKTMLARACASAFGSRGFISIKGPQILDPYVGAAEAKIRELFSEARTHYQEEGYPAVIFIDEADAILQDRNNPRGNGMEKTIVPAFLAEMDGLNESHAIVILATNLPGSLDPAITREGRIDRKIKVTRPNKEETASLLRLHFNKFPINIDSTLDGLCKLGAEQLFSSNRELFNGVYLRDVISGAMVTAVAEQTAVIARRRDMSTGEVSGISPVDVEKAVSLIFNQNKHMNHNDTIKQLEEERKHATSI